MRVLKFGGTSVGDAERIRGVVAIVRGRAAADGRVAVVVSAQSGVTNQLIELAHHAAAGHADPAPLRARLEGLIADLSLEPGLIDDELDELETLLRGISLVGDLTLRSLDRMMSFGERCSARISAAAMVAAGLPARAYMAYDVGLVTDATYGSAHVQPESYERIEAALDAAFDDGLLPVVTGFVAKDGDGYITTLGRGGSDYSAAIFGAALGAAEIEIWTDVDGVMSADPRIVAGARSLDRMSFEEAAELAYYGAKVIHPATIQPAVWKDIPIRVLNTMRPEHPGTLILRASASEPGVRSIASKGGITAVHVTSHRMLLQVGFMRRMFEVFERHQIVIDMISTSEVSVTVTTDNPKNLPAADAELREFSEVRVDGDKAILCLVGEGLRDVPDVLTRVFAVLQRESVPVRMVSVGASRINVSLLVDRGDEKRAVKALHAEFFGV
ncbi:MAG: Bifunctional aspartokinase/homoserine dehydrogenase 1 [Planctomycetes bacterium]|nr:Bifunctional aspartokinase/homoserine dehydrogenase 1 [Planctomycetota bacterium]